MTGVLIKRGKLGRVTGRANDVGGKGSTKNMKLFFIRSQMT